jgi:beta-glucanase (GH16 family)
MLPLAHTPSSRVLSLIFAVFLVAPTGFAQSDPFGQQFTFMNIWANNNGTPGAYITGVYQYGAADLVVEGNGAVGTAMTFKPNSYIYTSQTSTPKLLRYYEALTLKETTVSPGMSSASIVVNVTSVSLPANTEFYVVCKTLNSSFQETSAQRFRVTTTGQVTNTLTGLDSRVGNKLQVGFEMKGVTQTVADTGQVGLQIVSRSISGTPASYPPTTTSQLLRNGDFNISSQPISGVTLPDGYFWTPFEGAYVGAPSTVSTVNSPTGGNVLIVTGQPYAGAWHDGDNGIEVKPDGGKVFTLTFDAFFPEGYSSATTSISFWNNGSSTLLLDENLNGQIGLSSLENWQSYTVRYTATDEEFAALLTGKMRLKVQTEGRVGTALFDNFVLRQQTAAEVGPQLTVKVAGSTQSNGSTTALFPPLIGYSTPYAIVLQNDGAEPLNVSSVSISGSAFTWSGGSTASLQPGQSQTFTATAEPVSGAPLTGTLTVLSNDKEASDQTFVVELEATPVNLSDDFNSGTATSLGWEPFYDSRTSFDTAASVSVSGGALTFNVDSFNGAGIYPWYYGAKKVFASPGALDLLNSSLVASLRASGIYTPGPTNNKVQVYLESLNSAGSATGRVSLGQWVDETTAGAVPGSDAYFTPDGIDDRVAVLLPEGGGFTAAGGALASAIDEGFDPNAPAFQIVILMTDFEFDLDANNVVQVDSIGLSLATAPFGLANGSFETDVSDFGAGAAPAGWLQFPQDGVSKNLVLNGEFVYSASLGAGDEMVPFSAYAGTKAMKIYGQNFYDGDGVWQGPSQTGTVYQEWPLGGSTAGLSVGQTLHARGVAKVYGIDPLTGGSTFRYGFRYLDDSNTPVAPDSVTTITASTDIPDQWVPLVANGTIPAGTAKVQLIAEFVQNNATDSGAVYLDDLSVGFGEVPATVDVDGATYQLVWSDEFDGSALNTANWSPEIGTGTDGWGNQEVQFYTDRPENLRVTDGNLVIEAVKENYEGSPWTSARIKTQEKRSFKYGKIEFRAKLPSGVGPWPAAWMLGTNISTVGWPQCGEIDVMEWRGTGDDANTVGHALHSPARHGGNPVQPAERSPVTNPSTEFHTYAVVWTSNNMTFSVDGVDMATLTPPEGDADVFRKEFFLLLNLAMGGVYNGGAIDPALTNATYEVDYVRVYQPASSSPGTDTTPPEITLAGSNPVSVAWGSVYTDAGASAFDAGDNASVPVTAINPVDTTVPGTYQVTYSATDSKFNTATANRTVTVAMANGGTNKGTDGLSDIVRYAFGGTGTNALSAALMPSQTTTTSNGTNNLVLTYFARTNDNVTIVPTVSSDLAALDGWSTNDITVTTLQTGISTNGTTLHLRQAVTPVTGTRKFLRLEATVTP